MVALNLIMLINSQSQFLTQVAFIRMESRIDEALPLFEKAASIARTGPTFLNYGMALEASVFGLGRDDSSFNAPPTWPAALDTALEQYRAALMSQPGYVCYSKLRMISNQCLSNALG